MKKLLAVIFVSFICVVSQAEVNSNSVSPTVGPSIFYSMIQILLASTQDSRYLSV